MMGWTHTKSLQKFSNIVLEEIYDSNIFYTPFPPTIYSPFCLVLSRKNGMNVSPTWQPSAYCNSKKEQKFHEENNFTDREGKKGEYVVFVANVLFFIKCHVLGLPICWVRVDLAEKNVEYSLTLSQIKYSG